MAVLVGIDVGSSSVKVAVVEMTYRKTALVGLGAADISTDGPLEPLRTAIATALGARTGDSFGACLSGTLASLRILSLPASAAKQLADVLTYELEAQLPFDLDGTVFDYRILASSAENLVVATAVTRLSEVKRVIELIEQGAGSEPERVEVGGFALASLGLHVPGLADEGPLAVMDLGERSTDIVVLKAGEPVFGRTLSLGTTGLPESAASLAREVRLTLAAYRAQGGNAPTRLVLAGGGALVAGAKDFLQSELGLPVDFLPLPSIDLSAIAPELHGELVRHAKALSLAVGLGGRSRGLDLRRGPLIYERGWGWLRERVPLLFGLVAVVVVSFLFASWAKFHALAKERVVLEAALGLATKEVLGEETTSASRAADLVLLQTTIADEDPMPHADAFDVLVKLSEDIPQSMKHDIEEFDFQKNHVVVHGVVGTIPDAESIVGSLKNERCLSDIRITRTSAVVGGDRQKYAMEFDLKCPEDNKQVPKKGAASASSASSGGR